MPTYEVKVADETYVLAADSLRDAIDKAEQEDEKANGAGMSADSAKRIKHKIIGLPKEKLAQPKLWPIKES